MNTLFRSLTLAVLALLPAVASAALQNGKVQVGIPGFEVADGVFVGEGAEIHPDAVITGPAALATIVVTPATSKLSFRVMHTPCNAPKLRPA